MAVFINTPGNPHTTRGRMRRWLDDIRLRARVALTIGVIVVAIIIIVWG
jgi:hypothetical protein